MLTSSHLLTILVVGQSLRQVVKVFSECVLGDPRMTWASAQGSSTVSRAVTVTVADQIMVLPVDDDKSSDVVAVDMKVGFDSLVHEGIQLSDC